MKPSDIFGYFLACIENRCDAYEGDLDYEQVCECFDKESAELICNALNQDNPA